ncbi:MAG: 3-hydroxyanthranilate 3,4-dioxygenase, partial [bacterium]|nr:3-hydroxyanthranilate 3,4-dioxygenase [bacterium]
QGTQRTREPELTALNGMPFNLTKWIATSMSGNMGSVGNKEVFRHADFIFMIVKGPNQRNDYHIDPYDEIFYQLKGNIYVKYRDAQDREQVAEVKEGEVMIINAFTPHSPIRPPNTLGLVLERPRVAGEKDGILWYCDGCGHTLHQLEMDCQDIETQLKAELDAFNADLDRRTCANCGAVLPDPAAQPPWQSLVQPASRRSV